MQALFADSRILHTREKSRAPWFPDSRRTQYLSTPRTIKSGYLRAIRFINRLPFNVIIIGIEECFKDLHMSKNTKNPVLVSCGRCLWIQTQTASIAIEKLRSEDSK
eukprot:scaffold1080_cov195-Cylindrotheca_fusiformis.AAC.8